QEGKLLARKRLAATTDPAIHNGGFGSIQLQPIPPQSSADYTQHVLGLPLGPAVHDSVVGIPGESAIRMDFLHPPIKRFMHEQIHQYGADYRALRHPFVSLDD